MEWHRSEYTISTDRARLDLDTITDYLQNTTDRIKKTPTFLRAFFYLFIF